MAQPTAVLDGSFQKFAELTISYVATTTDAEILQFKMVNQQE